jgi:hypothetical protein
MLTLIQYSFQVILRDGHAITVLAGGLVTGIFYTADSIKISGVMVVGQQTLFLPCFNGRRASKAYL